MFRCIFCDDEVSEGGRLGHVSSKAHKEAAGDVRRFDEVYEPLGYTEPEHLDPAPDDPADDAPTVDVEARIAALEEELAAERESRTFAEARIEELSDENDKLRPEVDVTRRLFTTAEDVSAVFTDDALREIAAEKLASLNRGRLQRGHHPVTWEPAEWDAEIAQVREELAHDRDGLVPDGVPLTRVLKLVNAKKPGAPGAMVQVPMEDQVNNHKGSLADSIEVYRRKGFKVAQVRVSFTDSGEMRVDPNGTVKTTICASIDCWSPAPVDRGGKYVEGGYCSSDHRRRTEPANGTDGVTDGVTDRRLLNV